MQRGTTDSAQGKNGSDQRFMAKSSDLLVPYMAPSQSAVAWEGAIPSIGEETVVGVHGRLGWQREGVSGGGGKTGQESWAKEEKSQLSKMPRPLRSLICPHLTNAVLVLLAARGAGLGCTGSEEGAECRQCR